MNNVNEFIKLLNRLDVLPKRSLMNNSVYYKLVCLVNCTIGLYLSEHYSGIPVFLFRIEKEIVNLQVKYNCEYLTVCTDYCRVLFLEIENRLENDFGEIIPKLFLPFD